MGNLGERANFNLPSIYYIKITQSYYRVHEVLCISRILIWYLRHNKYTEPQAVTFFCGERAWKGRVSMWEKRERVCVWMGKSMAWREALQASKEEWRRPRRKEQARKPRISTFYTKTSSPWKKVIWPKSFNLQTDPGGINSIHPGLNCSYQILTVSTSSFPVLSGIYSQDSHSPPPHQDGSSRSPVASLMLNPWSILSLCPLHWSMALTQLTTSPCWKASSLDPRTLDFPPPIPATPS